jgi:hypothetical protein
MPGGPQKSAWHFAFEDFFMKKNLVGLLIVVGTIGLIPSGRAQSKSPSLPPASTVDSLQSSAPKVQFAETTFDFGKVDAGEVVRHDFVFTNLGSATLEIKDVRPACGCTTAGSWDKTVAPGKTGVIPLQFNSAGYGGPIAKSAAVTCNDPIQSNVVLYLKGTLWKPVDVTPSMVLFNLSSELQSNETRVVRIVNNLQEPVELSDLQCTNHLFQAALKTVQPGKEFELRIAAVPPFPAFPVTGFVTLKTSSPKIPRINVNAYLTLLQPVTVTPAQITLPPGPLTNAVHPIVTIRASGTNSVVLSDVGVNAPGVEVRVQEIQPGRFFSLMLDFPAGFQVQSDQKVELTAKSSHPRLPLIHVPVLQQKTGTSSTATRSASTEVQVQVVPP